MSTPIAEQPTVRLLQEVPYYPGQRNKEYRLVDVPIGVAIHVCTEPTYRTGDDEARALLARYGVDTTGEQTPVDGH